MLKLSPLFASLVVLTGLGGLAHADTDDSDAPPATSERFLLISATDDAQAEQGLGVATDALAAGNVAFDRYVGTEGGALRPGGDLGLLNADGSPKYSGIILTSGQAMYQSSDGQWHSALTDEQWAQLDSFEDTHKVRAVSLYSYPSPDLGMSPDPTATGDAVALKPAANAEALLTGITSIAAPRLENSWQYQAQIADPAVAQAVLEYDRTLSDGQTPVAAAVVKAPAGREELHFFFSQSRDMPLSAALAPLWMAWLVNGEAVVVDPNHRPSVDPFVGEWRSSFAGLNDDLYGGLATFTVDSTVDADAPKVYSVGWTIGVNRYKGPALRLEDGIVAAWGHSGSTTIVAYKIEADGKLSGSYRRDGINAEGGTETIAGVDLERASAIYEFTSTNAAQQTSSGSVRVTRQPNTYQMEFIQDGRSTAGVGLRVGDLLIVAKGSQLPFGLVEYRKEDGQLKGRWVRSGYDRVFDNSLSKSAL